MLGTEYVDVTRQSLSITCIRLSTLPRYPERGDWVFVLMSDKGSWRPLTVIFSTTSSGRGCCRTKKGTSAAASLKSPFQLKATLGVQALPTEVPSTPRRNYAVAMSQAVGDAANYATVVCGHACWCCQMLDCSLESPQGVLSQNETERR